MRGILGGAVLVALGLTGHFVLVGTTSSTLLVVLGAGLMLVSFARLRLQNGEVERRTQGAGLDVQERAAYETLVGALRARVDGSAERFAELQAIVEKTPGATAELAEVLREANGRLQPHEQLERALETGRRLDAEYRAELR